MIVATMASLKGREPLLKRVIDSLAPQVDAICVYLNGHEEIPTCLRHPKVLHAVLSKEAGWRGAEAKLWWWDRDQFKAAPEWRDDDIALICDDDIVYPSNYAARMVAELAAHPRSAVCVHGSIMMDHFVTYADSRWVARARGHLLATSRVHIPGTGTMAFRRGDIDFRLARDVSWSHCVDVCMAIAMKRAGMPCYAIARPDAWLVPMPLPVGTSIYRQRTGARNEQVETRMLVEQAPWEPLEAGMDGFVERVAKPTCVRPNRNSMAPREIWDFLAPRLAGRAGTFVELGSGHGTANLLAALPHGMPLISVEHDRKFVGLVRGTTYVHAPLRGGWYDAGLVARRLPPPGEIAAVLIDGPPGGYGRAGVLKHLELFGNAPIVLDDVHRPAELSLAKILGERRGVAPEIHECGGRAFASIGW